MELRTSQLQALEALASPPQVHPRLLVRLEVLVPTLGVDCSETKISPERSASTREPQLRPPSHLVVLVPLTMLVVEASLEERRASLEDCLVAPTLLEQLTQGLGVTQLEDSEVSAPTPAQRSDLEVSILEEQLTA